MNLAELKCYANSHDRDCSRFWNARLACTCEWRKVIGKLVAVVEAAKLVAYPRGFRDNNIPDDLHRALAALEEDSA